MFEYVIKAGQEDRYFEIATGLVPKVQKFDGFLGVERFQGRTNPRKYLSLVFWRDEAAIGPWRNDPEHRAAQELGKREILDDYRITVVDTLRSYTVANPTRSPDLAALAPLA